MKVRSRWNLAVLIAAGVLAATGWSACGGAMTMELVERAATRNLSTDLLQELPDGLHVVLCGAGSPLPDPARSGPCTAVIAGEQLWIVDAGSGASRMLSQLRIPQGRIAGVLLTHFHSDHFDGLGELLMQRWVNASATEPLPLHGPTGVAAISNGLRNAYSFDSEWRTAHHGEEVAPPSGAGSEPHAHRMPRQVTMRKIIEREGLVISAIRVDHAPVRPAFGYRFDYGGRSVVISGDTKKSAAVAQAAAGVDLLVHEALSPELVGALTRAAEKAQRPTIAKITRDILDYHTSPVEAAEIASEAQVGALLFHHIVPPLLLGAMEGVFLEGVDEAYDGPVLLGADGVIVTLEAGSDSIDFDELL